MSDCKSCCYWRKLKDREEGFCKRYPPSVFVIPEQFDLAHTSAEDCFVVERYPRTKDTGWCGEWKENDK